MSAQEKWKDRWHMFRRCVVKGAKKDHRLYMRFVRREAALERRIAALERQNVALLRRIDSLQMTIGADRLHELVLDRIGYEQ